MPENNVQCPHYVRQCKVTCSSVFNMLRQHRSHVLFHSQKPLISIFDVCEHMHIIAMAHLGVLDMGVQMFTQRLVSALRKMLVMSLLFFIYNSPHMSRTLVGEIRTPNHWWYFLFRNGDLNISWKTILFMNRDLNFVVNIELPANCFTYFWIFIDMFIIQLYIGQYNVQFELYLCFASFLWI